MSQLRKVILSRIIDTTKQTLGSIIMLTGNDIWMAKSLELPWDKNINDISCIPVGNYRCIWSRSTRLSLIAGHDVYTYEVLGVPNRSGIRIHSANYFFELKGCIAMGSVFKDINLDRQLDVVHSGNTVIDFNARMNKQDFELIIESVKFAA